jgi:LysM repeat protein
MRVGKKLVVVLSVLATGIGAAIFFRKDASQVDTRQGTLSNPFGQRVERRILAGAAWARKIGGPLPALPGRPPQPLRVPASATAAILEPKALTPEAPPIFQKTSPSVGALLEPIDGVLPDDEKPGAAVGFEPPDEPDSVAAGAPQTHKIVDGDTLSKIASRYLGRADRFLEVFELNRDVLSSPDLLPIGSTLKIPPRGAKPPTTGVPTRDEPRLEAPRPVAGVPGSALDSR